MGVLRRWVVAFIVGGLVVVPRVAQAGAGLGLEMVCADAVNATPLSDRMPPFARLLGVMPAHPTPVPTAVCLKDYGALWSRSPAARGPAAPDAPVPAATRDLAGEGRRLGLYVRYVGALLGGLPADLALRRDRVRAAAAVRLALLGEGLAASAYRPVAVVRPEGAAPSEGMPARMAHLLYPDAQTFSP
ncbi:hypothetical protein [Azospirillum sp. B4]|uniref:hypothetical protein n=1 Tax=Azospirillum sp. B4 TaxID=95605 RepID=UPI00034931EC|nr:hypothetical protein [Azospirillum sp. B4]